MMAIATQTAPTGRLAAFYFFFFAAVGLMLPFLPPYLAARGLDAADIGLALAAMTVAKIAAPALWGTLSDRSGRPLLVVRFGASISVLALAALGFATGFWELVIVLAAYGVFGNAVLPQFEVVTLRYLAARESSYGRIRLWGSIGFIIAVLVAGWLFQGTGLHWLPAMLVGLYLAIIIVVISLPSERSALQKSSVRAPPFAWTPAIAAFFVTAALLAASHGPYYAFFSIHMAELGHSNMLIAALWALAVIAEVALFWFAPAVLARTGPAPLLFGTLAISAGRWLLLAVGASSLAVATLSQVLHAVSFGLFHLCAMEFIRRQLPPACHGRGQALHAALGFGLGGALGSFAGGQLWQALGPQLTYAWAASLCLIGCLCVARWCRD